MRKRLKEMRETLQLSQAELGEKVGVSGAAVSRWESGERAVPDVCVRAAVREFGVSETWLRTGAGEMFQAKSREEELGALADSLFRERPGSFRAAVVTTLLRFDPDGPEWEVLERIYRGIAAELTTEEPPNTEK